MIFYIQKTKKENNNFLNNKNMINPNFSSNDAISTKNHKGLFASLMEKMRGMIAPIKDDNLKMTITGGVAVKIGDDYYTIDNTNTPVTYPEASIINIPMFLYKKPVTAVVVGDIIKIRKNSYAKVLNKKDDGSIRAIKFDGTTTTIKPVKDVMLGNQAYFPVVYNLVSFNGTGLNPQALMMMNLLNNNDGDTSDKKDLLMMMMMSGGGNIGSMLPLLLLSNNDSETSSGGFGDMMKMMFLSSMFNQQQQPMYNPMGNMFGGMMNGMSNMGNMFGNMFNGMGMNMQNSAASTTVPPTSTSLNTANSSKSKTAEKIETPDPVSTSPTSTGNSDNKVENVDLYEN